jgi:hypothetical protein
MGEATNANAAQMNTSPVPATFGSLLTPVAMLEMLEPADTSSH